MPAATRRRLSLLAAIALAGGLAAAVVPHGFGTGPAAAAPARVPQTAIAVDTRAEHGVVNPASLGHAYLWAFDGMGSYDSAAGRLYPAFVRELQTMRPGSLRWPGGITGEFFHWQRAIGPQAQRTPSPYGPAQGPSAADVGPDEFGRLLDATHARGVVTANFATGSAAEAAAFVAYLTGAPGSSSWADLRVHNGHRAPYDVPYWEVGNEEYGSPYWRSGTPVTVGGPPGACASVSTCLYIYGGSTRFTKQPVVGYADRTPAAADSTAVPGQSFYAAYPPVSPGSATVYVGGAQWTEVADLTAAGPADDVYTLDPATGKITFGDGVHGAIPPSGAQVTASYVSGPHDGFVQFYRAMKAANPRIAVCSSDDTSDFVTSMGNALPYDCVQYHPYVSTGNVANGTPIDQYQNDIMAVPDAEAQSAANLAATIRAAAGHDVPLVLTEYGQLLSSNPTGYPYYHESLDEALLNASQLADWIRLGVPVADRQLLTAEIPPPDQCCAGLPAASPYASTAAIGTPGPDTVLEATGAVYQLFAPLAGGSLLGTQVLGDPGLPTSSGASTAALDVLAARAGSRLRLLVINRDPSHDVTARVLPEQFHDSGRAEVQTLDGPSSLAYNTVAQPDTVRLATHRITIGAGVFDYTFPAHSATLITLDGWVREQPASLQLAAPTGPVQPGGRLTLSATVRNDGDQAVDGTVAPQLPAGWTAAPATLRYAIAPHAAETQTFQVTVPADAAEQRYQVGAILYSPGPWVADVASTDVVVRELENWQPVFTDTFEGQPVGAPPAGYTIDGPPGSFTVQPAPDETGQALRIQKTDPATGLMTAGRSFDPVTGAVRLRLLVRADQTDTALGIQLLDRSGNPDVKLSLATAGDLAWTDGTSFVRGATYTSDQWYTLEVDTDPASGHYKLYVDDVLTAQPALDTAAGPPAEVLLQMPGSPATPGTFYADDISIAHQ